MSVTLQEIMATDLRLTDPGATVAEAAATMVAARIGSALVMTGTTLVGIITERDVLRAAGSGDDVRQGKVRDWMTPDPVTVGPDVDVEKATELRSCWLRASATSPSWSTGRSKAWSASVTC